jgi:hypothetical protein
VKYFVLLTIIFFMTHRGIASGTNTAGNRVVDVILVVGAPGESAYGQTFAAEAQDWTAACRAAHKSFWQIDPSSADTNELEIVKQAIRAQQHGEEELWIALIGHGTFDGTEAKFNLSGPDLSASELSNLLAPVQRPLILVDTSAASAPFINALSHENRVIITATKSGAEENYTRFGKFFAKSLSGLDADIDKDGQVSALEAFLNASRQVEEFYKSERRLATEHALIDDNGDGKGTPAGFFNGVRPAKKAGDAAMVDGFRAHQIQFIPNEAEAKLSPAVRKRRNELELALEKVRARKAQLSEADYLKEIEPILLQLSHLYEDAGALKGLEPQDDAHPAATQNPAKPPAAPAESPGESANGKT